MALKIWNESALLKALFAGKPGNPMTAGQAAAFDTAFPNNVALKWSNAAGTAEVEAIKVNASNGVEVNAVAQINDTNGNEALKVTTTASAVNELTIIPGAAGSAVQLATTGGDTNINFQLIAKGTTGNILMGGYGGVTATAGAATGASQRGYVTTESITTAAGAAYTLTLTNPHVLANSVLLFSVANGTNTQGRVVAGRSKVTAAGTGVFIVENTHASQALNGTLEISYVIA